MIDRRCHAAGGFEPNVVYRVNDCLMARPARITTAHIPT
jgi:hypothetical protein